QAEAQMKTIASRLAQQYPDTDADTTVNLKPLREQVVGDVRLSLLVLMGAVCLVVLIACANVANLLLARATARRKELAVRAALGASRARILAQLLTESVLLGVIGGALGLLIAYWGIAAVVRLWADQIPRAQDVHIDLTVLGFSLALSVLTGLVFGLAPALHAATPNLYDALKDAARSVGASGRSQRLRHALVVAELALAVVLVTGAGLLIRSFLRLQNVQPGFNPQHLMTFTVELPSTSYPKREQQVRLFEQLQQRVESLPGIESAGAASTLPLGGNSISFSFDLLSRPLPRSQQMGSDFDAVTPNYFHAMQVPLLRGRFFTDQDSEKATRVVILDRAFTELYFPNEDPIGQKMIISYMAQRVPYEVIGIVGEVKQRRLESAFQPHMYTPMA